MTDNSSLGANGSETNRARQAAAQLLRSRVTHQPMARLAEAIRPRTLDEALAVQRELIRQHPEPLVGWKCALPSADKLVLAPIFSGTLYRGSACAVVPEQGRAWVEPEIAFVLATDLPARSGAYRPDEVDAALGSCHMALELVQHRYAAEAEAGFLDQLADGLLNQGLFLGPKIDRAAAFQCTAMAIRLQWSGRTQSLAGVHPNQLPQLPLYWLVNYLSQSGVGLSAGQVIITGTYAGLIDVPLASPFELHYEGLGQCSLTIEARPAQEGLVVQQQQHHQKQQHQKQKQKHQ
ncbi:fumarylacetoacetate hydrolase family protein [Reinekea sp.]|uniref:fumarylacetoacetate hydrolase family protein n=1 Tax=Reinekea sp. TaxID=1970455 RepID=UPI002A7FCE2B|nr:fumarylacetoacetate hydrolase family protein [Reinekea sp.]